MYRAPTWSWASTDEPVQFGFWKSVRYWDFSTQKEDNCIVEDVYCQNLLQDNTTGPVTTAHLTLTGPLVPVELAVLNSTLMAEASVEQETIAHGSKSYITLVRARNLRAAEVSLDVAQQSTFADGDTNLGCWQQRECKTNC